MSMMPQIRWRLLRVIPFLVMIVIPFTDAWAHETDQYAIPQREFADLGESINRWAYGAIERGVSKINARVADAIRAQRDRARIEELLSADAVAAAVNAEFPYAVTIIEDLDRHVQSEKWKRVWPGKLVGYKPPPSISKYLWFPFNPVRAWDCATVKVYGVYMGNDKIGHFTDMGIHYYNAYRSARRKGATEDEAMAAAVKIGTDDPILGEKGVLGWVTAGDYSNADLASNYSGLLFYRNLTDAMKLKGTQRPPMLVRDGDQWRIAPHVRPDSGFMRWFISEHFDEALNPGWLLPMQQKGFTQIARDNAQSVLNHRCDANGNRRSRQWLAKKHEEMRSYYGDDYGHGGAREELVLIDRACFPQAASTDISARDARGYQAIHRAGDADLVRKLIADGSDVNSRVRSDESASPEWGATPLHLAARDGNEAVVNALLSAGADVNAVDDRGATALHWSVGASGAGPGAMVQILVQRGTKVDSTDERGRTALHWAANAADAEAVGELLELGASATLADRDGRTALHLACAAGSSASASALIQRGAESNPRDSLGQTPLHLAAAARDAASVEVLLGAGASASGADVFGRTPLHDAARRGAAQIVQMLMDTGRVRPQVTDVYGTTPLHLATRHGHGQTERLLRAWGTDPIKATSEVSAAPPAPPVNRQ
jgi:ankyrin repeat protein